MQGEVYNMNRFKFFYLKYMPQIHKCPICGKIYIKRDKLMCDFSPGWNPTCSEKCSDKQAEKFLVWLEKLRDME